jgi:glycosyltransferase A (GT-A) superfamily protein (DUF2064 family)
MIRWSFPDRPRNGRFCLLVVAKAPVPGLAKTRLTPPATPRQAAAIASAALLATLATVRDTPGAVPVVAMTGDLDLACGADELRAALAPMTVLEQRGEDFADRLANAHTDAAGCCPGLPVVQIGMDTPQATPGLLAETAALLRRRGDIVLGPAPDGGWWALGLGDPRRAAALRGVPMSRGDTAAHTLAALVRRGTSAMVTATLSDVDNFADAVRVADALPGSRFATAVAAVSANTAVAL